MIVRSVRRMALAALASSFSASCSTVDTSGTIDVVHVLPGAFANSLRGAISRVEIVFDEPVGSDQLFLSPRGEQPVDFGGGIQGTYGVEDVDGDQKYEGLTVVNANPFKDSLTWTSQYYSEAKLGGGFWIRGKIYSGTSPQTLVAEAVKTLIDGDQGTIQFGGGLKTVTLVYGCAQGVSCLATTDAGADAGADAGVAADAGTDAGADAGVAADAGTDAGDAGASADASVVTVTDVSPRFGVVGTAVSITGSGFSPYPNVAWNNVRFGGIAATITDASATSLQVIAPVSASGAVVVSTALDAGTADGGEFSYLYVTAVHETLMHYDAGMRSVWIEGSFYSQPGFNYQVRFDTWGGGGVSSAYLGLDGGQNRLEASLPQDASAASVSVSIVTPGVAIGTLPFRLAPFPLGLGPFSLAYEQIDVARPAPRLVTARSGHCTVKAGPYLYVIGGEVTTNSTVGTIERALINADGTIGAFRVLSTPVLQTARAYHGCVVLGSNLYVIAGVTDNNNTVLSVETASVAADGTLGSFSFAYQGTGPSCAEFVLEVIGRYVYLVGGTNGGAVNTVARAPILADGTLGSFSTAGQPTLSVARRGAAGVVLGTKFYVIGGWDNVSTLHDTYDIATINADGTLGSFSSAGAYKLSQGRRGHAVVTLGGAVHILGGYYGTSTTLDVESAPISADGTLGAGSTAMNDLAVARENHTATVVGNYVYVVGGASGSNSLSTVERAPIIGNGHALGNATLLSTPSLNTPRDGVSAVVIGNYLYVIGGEDSQYHSLDTVERATINTDGTLGSFVTDAGGPMLYPRSSPALAVAGDRLYVMGGAYDSGVYPAPTEWAPIGSDNTLGPFTAGPSLYYPRTQLTSAVLGNRLYTFAGWALPSGESNDVEYIALDADGGFDGGGTHSDMLGTGRTGGRTIVINGRPWILGGDTLFGTTKEGQASILDDAGIAGFVDAGILLGDTRESFGAAMVGDYMYVFGGGMIAGPPANSVERGRIDTSSRSFLGTFSNVTASLYAGRARPAAVVIGDYLYILGGKGDAGALSSVERIPIQ